VPIAGRFFLEDRENEAGADDGKQPDELSLKHLLPVLEHLAAKDANREPRLESHHHDKEQTYGDLENSHGERT
jgi:hypothetical protein